MFSVLIAPFKMFTAAVKSGFRLCAGVVVLWVMSARFWGDLAVVVNEIMGVLAL